jgi:hypothetical protein
MSTVEIVQAAAAEVRKSIKATTKSVRKAKAAPAGDVEITLHGGGKKPTVKLVTPQVEALPGVTPLGIPENHPRKSLIEKVAKEKGVPVSIKAVADAQLPRVTKASKAQVAKLNAQVEEGELALTEKQEFWLRQAVKATAEAQAADPAYWSGASSMALRSLSQKKLITVAKVAGSRAKTVTATAAGKAYHFQHLATPSGKGEWAVRARKFLAPAAK